MIPARRRINDPKKKTDRPKQLRSFRTLSARYKLHSIAARFYVIFARMSQSVYAPFKAQTCPPPPLSLSYEVPPKWQGSMVEFFGEKSDDGVQMSLALADIMDDTVSGRGSAQ